MTLAGIVFSFTAYRLAFVLCDKRSWRELMRGNAETPIVTLLIRDGSLAVFLCVIFLLVNAAYYAERCLRTVGQ
jgi:hypothetical protein